MSDNVWLVPLIAVLITQVAVLATSVYLHRGLAHRSLNVHAPLGLLFRALLWLSTGMRRSEWVAVHRKHHAFTDREGDPHSPRIFGFWKVQLGNVFYYVRAAASPDLLTKFAPDLPEDAWDRCLFSRGWAGLLLGTAILCLAIGLWPGILAMVLHWILYVFVVAPTINGLGHWRGRQNFLNTAYNSRVLAWFTGGESLHNNHHAHPRAPKFSVRRSEFDPSWAFIKLCAALKLLVITGVPVRIP